MTCGGRRWLPEKSQFASPPSEVSTRWRCYVPRSLGFGQGKRDRKLTNGRYAIWGAVMCRHVCLSLRPPRRFGYPEEGVG